MDYAEFKKVVKALKVVIEASDAKEVNEEFKVKVSFLLKGYIEGTAIPSYADINPNEIFRFSE